MRPRVIKFTGEQEFEPVRGYDGDAGFDLFCSETTVVPYQAFIDIPCGINVELPRYVWAMIIGRSSTLRRRRLLVSQAVIDNGYRGPLYAGAQNLHDGRVVVEKGERIAQLIPFYLMSQEVVFEYTSKLSRSDRGENGFGSSGS